MLISSRVLLQALSIVMLVACVSIQFPLPLLSQNENSDSLYVVYQNGKWGYANRRGNIVIKPQFASANPFEKGVAEVWPMKAARSVFIDKKGNILGSPAALVKDSPDDLVSVVVEGKLVYSNRSGDILIRGTFTGALNFSEGLGAVKVNGKWGYIDSQQRMVIEPRFATAEPFHEGLAAVTIIRENPATTASGGEKISRPRYYGRQENEVCAFIDRSGEIAIDPKVDECRSFSEGLAPAAMIEPGTFALKWGYIDRTGSIAIPMTFRDTGGGLLYAPPVRDFSEGLAPVRIGPSWGYIDRTGRVVIAPQFENALGFSDGLALVSIGRTVAEFPYRGYSSLHLRLIGKWGYIDQTGKFVSEKLSWVGK